MTVEECNVICVDWEAGAVIPNYVRAAANTRLVGKQLSMLLEGLNKHLGLPFHNVHVIGFSLGAHVAGFAGAELKNLSRITGLDPAAPLFESQDPRARLDSTDAMFVDVIHSNGENLILGGLGSWQPMGHVDFYPNGGRMQKGCTNLFVGAVTDILWSASDVEGRSLCNHRRAYKFFTDSVSPRCHFPSFPCESYDKFLEGHCFPCNGDRRCGNMGYFADRSNGRGTLFLITREEEPFCAHQYHVRVESSPSPVPVTSYGKIQLTLIGDSDINETFTLTQKDDDELKVGSSLARIAVPHPVLQEPKSVQIMYTAYSGWISSGLAKWSIDKVTLTDSFGKSMSICKKGLFLESGIPVDLPLYAGDCNPPRDNAVEVKEDWITTSPANGSFHPAETESEKNNPSEQALTFTSLNDTGNSTKYTPTPVVLIGDELLKEDTRSKGVQNVDSKQDGITLMDASGLVAPLVLESLSWQPIDYFEKSNSNSLDGTHNKRENSRAFSTHITTIVIQNRTAGNYSSNDITKNNTAAKHNNTSSLTWPGKISDRHEIKEPVLIRSSTSHPSIWPRETSAIIFTKDVLATLNSTSESQMHGKPQITEPVLNPKTTTTPHPKLVNSQEFSSTVSTNYRERKMKWMLALDLNPPPIDNGQTWEHWVTETTASNSGSPGTEMPILEDKSYDTYKSLNETNEEGRRLTTSSPMRNSKKSYSLPITIQFFPQRLAALLAQAERYAKLTLSFPMAAISKLGYYRAPSLSSSEDDQAASASTKEMHYINTQFLSERTEDSSRRNPILQTQRRPKLFTTTKPPIGNSNSKSSRMNNTKTVSLPATIIYTTSTSATSSEGSYKSQVSKEVEIFGKATQMKDMTHSMQIFVPYTYAYVSDDSQDAAEESEVPRYIPLLRYPYITDSSKYETWQSYNTSNSKSNQNLSEKPAAHINNKEFNSTKNGDTNNKYFGVVHQDRKSVV